MMPAYLGAMGLAYFAAERYDDAVEWAKRSIRAGGSAPFSIFLYKKRR